MTPRNRYTKRNPTQRPSKVETAADRGQVLQWWLDKNDFFQEDFARACKISPATLTLYLSGGLDLANARQTTVEKLLAPTKISDTEAWEMFNIPLSKRTTFRTFREPPLGHGEDVRKLVELRLAGGLAGDITAPAGYSVQYDPAKKSSGIVVTQMADGALYALRAEIAVGRGDVLGQFVGVFGGDKN